MVDDSVWILAWRRQHGWSTVYRYERALRDSCADRYCDVLTTVARFVSEAEHRAVERKRLNLRDKRLNANINFRRPALYDRLVYFF